MLELRLTFRPMPDMDDATVVALAADNLVHVMRELRTGHLQIVVNVLGHDMWAINGDFRDAIVARWNAKLEERPTGYVCGHCLASSPKELWGPGRITCPRCGKMADAADGSPRGVTGP